MAQPAHNISGNLETIIHNVNGLYVISDTHQHPEILKNTMRKAANDNSYVLFAGDGVNDYSFSDVMKEATQKGYKFYSQLEIEFIGKAFEDKKVSELEFLTYQTAKIAQTNQAPIEEVLNYLEKNKQIDSTKKEQISKMVTSEVLEKKLQNLSKEMYQTQEFQYHMSRAQNLYFTFMDEEAQRIAQDLNESPETKVYWLNGNHEPIFFPELVRKYLDNKDQLVDIGSSEKSHSIKLQNGQEITLAGDTNCLQMMPYVNEIFPLGSSQELYAHMYKGISEKNLLMGDKTSGDVTSSALEGDWYSKIKESLNNKQLDILAVHGQIGKPQTTSGNSHDVPYKLDVAKLSLESKLVIEGHIHSRYEGENSFGTKMVRSVGENAAYITKDDTGEMNVSWENVGTNYNGGSSNPLIHDAAYYVEKASKTFDEVQKSVEDSNSKA